VSEVWRRWGIWELWGLSTPVTLPNNRRREPDWRCLGYSSKYTNCSRLGLEVVISCPVSIVLTMNGRLNKEEVSEILRITDEQ
jgi:hypothetical protein